MSGNNKPIFDGLGNANWFSPENMRDNYDGVDGRKPDGQGSGVDPETMVGLRDLPPEEITRICHAINTRTTAIPLRPDRDQRRCAADERGRRASVGERFTPAAEWGRLPRPRLVRSRHVLEGMRGDNVPFDNTL